MGWLKLLYMNYLWDEGPGWLTVIVYYFFPQEILRVIPNNSLDSRYSSTAPVPLPLIIRINYSRKARFF